MDSSLSRRVLPKLFNVELLACALEMVDDVTLLVHKQNVKVSNVISFTCVCTECSARFDTYKDIDRHMKMTHTEMNGSEDILIQESDDGLIITTEKGVGHREDNSEAEMSVESTGIDIVTETVAEAGVNNGINVADNDKDDQGSDDDSLDPHVPDPHCPDPHVPNPHAPVPDFQVPDPHASHLHAPNPHAADPPSPNPHAADPQIPDPHAADPQTSDPHASHLHAPDPHAADPQTPDPHAADLQTPDLHAADPQTPEPHAADPQTPDPHSPNPHAPVPDFHASHPHAADSHVADPQAATKRPDKMSPPNTMTRFNCGKCSEVFTSKGDFENHAWVHPDYKPFVCDICENAYFQYRSMTKHRRMHFTSTGFTVSRKSKLALNHANVKLRKQERLKRKESLPCGKCSEVLPTKSQLEKHALSHHGYKPFVCSVCGAAYTLHRSLLKHGRESHNIQQRQKSSSSDGDPDGSSPCGKNNDNNETDPNTGNTGSTSASSTGTVVITSSLPPVRLKLRSKPASVRVGCSKVPRKDPDRRREIFPCDRCSKIFETKSLLERHAVDHPGYKPFVCNACDAAYTLCRSLFRHRREQHSDTQTGTKNPSGVSSNAGKGDGTQHSENGGDTGETDSNISDKIISSKSPDGTLTRTLNPETAVESHKDNGSIGMPRALGLKRVHDKTTTSQGITTKQHGHTQDPRSYQGIALRKRNKRMQLIGPFACPDCPQRFRSKVSLNSHSIVHRRERTYPCDECTIVFNTKRDLENHAKAHPGYKPFVCRVCGNSYALCRSLMKHVRLMKHQKKEELKKFTAPPKLRETRTSSLYNLRVHKKRPKGEKPFQCNVCDAEFVAAGPLSRHQKNHLEKTVYQCDRCEKRFLEKTLLNRHYLHHTGEKPYLCELCGKTYRYKMSASRCRKKHSSKRIHCPTCNKGFVFNGELQRHVRIVHPSSSA